MGGFFFSLPPARWRWRAADSGSVSAVEMCWNPVGVNLGPEEGVGEAGGGGRRWEEVGGGGRRWEEVGECGGLVPNFPLGRRISRL